MKRRMHLKAKRKKGKQTFILIILILVIIVVFICFYYINKKIAPNLMGFAEIEAGKMSSTVINLAIAEKFKDDDTIEQLFHIQKNDDDEIQLIDFKTNLVNKYLTDLTKYIQEYFQYIEKGEVERIDPNVLKGYNIDNLRKGIIYQLPMGLALNNSLFSNIGPKIPVRISLVGDITSNINTKITDYGINNALLEISIHVEIANMVILPLLSKKVITKIDVPLVIKVIQGKIPSSYFSTISKNSPTVMLPME